MASAPSDINPTRTLPGEKKPRRKGRLRSLIVVTALLVLLSGAGYLLWCVAFDPLYSEEEIEAKVAEIKARLVPAPIPDERNRAAAYRAALSKWMNTSNVHNLPGYQAFLSLPSPWWSPKREVLAAMRADLGSEAAHLDHLIAASNLPDCVWPDDDLVYGPAGNPNGPDGVMDVLTASRILCFGAWTSFDAGEDERGAVLLATELRLGCDLNASASLVRRMVAGAMIALACDTIRNLCGQNMMTTQARTLLMAVLRQCLADEAPIEESFEVELVTEQEGWDDAVAQSSVGMGIGYRSYLLYVVPKPYVRSKYFEGQLAMIEALKLAPNTAKRVLKALADEAEGAGPFDSLLLPPTHTASWAYDQMLVARMNLRGTLALLMLLDIRDRDGLYPEKLTPESTGLSAKELTDPFKGAYFSYQRWGESFRLWSVGVEGNYQGGLVDPKLRDFHEIPLFWPLPTR